MQDVSKVFWSDFRVKEDGGIEKKLKNLCKKAGISQIDFEKKFTAIKVHFGEDGNLSFLRPDYARAVAEVVRELGGVPFLTDCNTLYPGSRKNAVDHLFCAQKHGFNFLTTTCQTIIADGLKGTDDIEVPIVGGIVLKTAKIGRAIMDADVFISLAHFKGHEEAGFGGAIKNVGMGCGSRAGKMIQHNAGKPLVNQDFCKSCKKCAKECGSDAISYRQGKAFIDQNLCKGCGRCIGACNFDAIYNPNEGAFEDLNKKMAEYTKAVCYERSCFFINVIREVSPWCDCHSYNDAPLIPDIGMLASFDPVALDQASSDLCMKAERQKDSQIADRQKNGENLTGDLWKDSTPQAVWEVSLSHAEKIALGCRKYELIKID